MKTNNPTIDGVSRELLRKQFEEKNEHRGWFVPGGIAETDTPEGFVYSDFTTDMCWTCYFEANATLQSTIARLEARIAELESGRGEADAWALVNGGGLIRDLTDRWDVAKHWEGDVRALYFDPPAPVAVVLPERMKYTSHDDTSNYKDGWNACLDATAALNGQVK